MNGMEIIFIFQKKESKMQIDKVQTQCKSIIEETSSEVCYTSFADYSLLTFDSGRREHEKESYYSGSFRNVYFTIWST